MSDTTVRQDWCPIHGFVKVQRDAGIGSNVTWWECAQCCEAPRAADAKPEGEREYTDSQNLVAVWNAIRRVLGDPAARLISDSIAIERANKRAVSAIQEPR